MKLTWSMVAMHRSKNFGWRAANFMSAILLFFLHAHILSAAPTSYNSFLPQSGEIAEYFSDLSGCYYNFQRYDEGDRIVTNEPCLNCTCHNRMLMCYLRVCPFTKAVGPDCTIEKKPDQCCPVITCPEVPVKLLTSSTTSSPTPTTVPVKLLTSSTTTSLTSTTPTTELGFHDNYGCNVHDSFYAEGAQVLSDGEKPCELCYCIRNRTICVMQECTLHVDGCKPVYRDGVCCPVRYDCGEGVTATVWPSITSISQSKSSTPQPAQEILSETEKVDVTERLPTTYNQPSTSLPVSYQTREPESSSSSDRNTFTTREFDKTTTGLNAADEGATKFVFEKSTAKVPEEADNEIVTENFNTVSDRNTQSLPHESSTNPRIPSSVETTIRYPPAETTRPDASSEKVSYTEMTEEQSTAAGIPGEGNCLVDGITYLNNSIIESSNPCHAKCVCMSSIPTCTLVTCDPPPNDPKCMPLQIKPESCCPVYICSGNERLPPVAIPSHNHVVPDQPVHDEAYTTESVIHYPSSSPSAVSEVSDVEKQPQPEKSTETVPASGAANDFVNNYDTSHDELPVSETEKPSSEVPFKESSFAAPSTETASTEFPHNDVVSSSAPADKEPEPVLVDAVTEYVHSTSKPEEVEYSTTVLTSAQESSSPSSNDGHGSQNGNEYENEVQTATPASFTESSVGLKNNFTESVISKGTTAAVGYDKTEAPVQSDLEIGDEKSSTSTFASSSTSHVPSSSPSVPVTVQALDLSENQDVEAEITTAAPYENNEIHVSSESPTPVPGSEKVGSTMAPIIPTKIIAQDLSDSLSTEHVGVTSQGLLWNDSGASTQEEHAEPPHTTTPPVSVSDSDSEIPHTTLSPAYDSDSEVSPTAYPASPEAESEVSQTTASPLSVSDPISQNGQEYVETTTRNSAGSSETSSSEVNYETSTGTPVSEEVPANTVISEIESPTTKAADEASEGAYVTNASTETVTEHVQHEEHSEEPVSAVPSDAPQFSSSSESDNLPETSPMVDAAAPGADKVSSGVQQQDVTTAALAEVASTTEVVRETAPPRPSDPTKLAAEGYQSQSTPAPAISSSDTALDTNDILSTEKEAEVTTAAAEVSSEATTVTEFYTKVSSSPAPSSTSAGSSTQYEEVNTTLPPLPPSPESPASSETSHSQPAETTTIPSAPAHEEVATKVPESNEISSESEPITSVPVTYPLSTASPSSPRPTSVASQTFSSPAESTLETRFNETEKQTLNVTEVTTESGYTPIQQSTWSVKPVEQEVTSESYYPQHPMYPTGGVDNTGGAAPGTDNTSMEEYDEDPNAFGPGTCRYGGKLYVSAQQIPRDDPCDFCFCFRSDIICLQQSCPPPIHGCRQEPIQGFCCPRYECPVARDVSYNITSSTTTTPKPLPLRSRPSESHRGGARTNGCVINGYFYNVGDDIDIASGPCLECICGTDGRMKCEPKSCSPEPFARQLMGEAASKR